MGIGSVGFNSKINLSSDKAFQLSGSTLNLSGVTQIHNSGKLIIPTPITSTEAANREYVDNNSGVLSKNHIYISSIYGNDLNSGLNSRIPVKTISKAIELISQEIVIPSENNIWTIICDGNEIIDLDGITELPQFINIYAPNCKIMNSGVGLLFDVYSDIVCDVIEFGSKLTFNINQTTNKINIIVNKLICNGGYDPLISVSNLSKLNLIVSDVVINDINDNSFIYVGEDNLVNINVNNFKNTSFNKVCNFIKVNSGNTVTINVTELYSNDSITNGFTTLKIGGDNNKITTNFQQIRYTGGTNNTSILKVFSGCTGNNVSIIGNYSEFTHNNISYGLDGGMNEFDIYNISEVNNTINVYINQYQGKRYYYPSKDIDVVNNIEIYLSNNGNDLIGDGTINNPYLTIGRALQDVYYNLINSPSIDFYFETGTYGMYESDFYEISKINGSGSLSFNGNKTIITSGFTTIDSTIIDPLTYNVSGGTSGSWITNEHRFKYIKSDDTWFPITNNTQTTISTTIDGLINFNEIYDNDVTIDIYGNVLLSLSNTEISMSFIDLNFNLINNGFNENSNYINVEFNSCNILNGKTSIGYYYNCILNGSVLTYTNNSVFRYYIDNTYIFNTVINISDSEFNFYNVVLDNCNFSVGSGKLSYVSTINNNFLKLSNNTKIYLYGKEFSFIDNNNSNNYIILDNVNVLFEMLDDIDININIMLFGDKIYNQVNDRYINNDIYELINHNKNKMINIKDILYPEFEYNLVNTLTNSGTTNIVIGNVNQNKSITVEYTITRGNGLRTGRFDVLYDSNNIYIGTDEFITNGNINVNVSNIVFDANLNGDEIRMECVLSDDVDGTIEYNLKRKLITPINI